MSAETDLIELLEQSFNEDELRILCADLHIPYESIAGDNNKRKAYEMVGYAQRRNQLDLLIEKVAQERPHLQPQLEAISQQTKTHTTDPFKNRLFILIGAGIVLIIVLILGVWSISSFFTPNEPTATDTAVPADRFTYQIRVQEDVTDQPIEDAKITISLPGTTPVNEYTDSTGLAVFRIDNQFAGKLVVLHITKDGYKDWNQNITIEAGEQPKEIKLPPVP